jgi:hypothetical protein
LPESREVRKDVIMPALVEVTAGEGVVLFQGEFSDSGQRELEEIAIKDKVQDVVSTTRASAAMVADTVQNCAATLIAAFDNLAARQGEGGSLSEAVVELGVSVTGEGNVIVMKGSADANLKVTLTWQFS